ncbi:hypothetical protein HFK18_21635, partial
GEARGLIEEVHARMIVSVTDTAENPGGAILAFLALKRLELHDLHPWSDAERADILRDIRWLVDAEHMRSQAHGASAGH